MLLGTGGAIILESVTSLLEKVVLLLETVLHGFTNEDVGKVLPDKPALFTPVEGPFFALPILDGYCTFK